MAGVLGRVVRGRRALAVLGVAGGLAAALLPGTGAGAAVLPGVNDKVVFASDRSGNSEIYVMNADGSSQTRLTTHSASDIVPAWTPDGRIAWSANREAGRGYDIYVMNADGTGVTNLTRAAGSDRFPSYSPDGTEIVFMSTRDNNGNFEIYTMKADGTSPKRLTFTANVEECCPDWSPDGSLIVFQTLRDGNFEIYTMNPDGSNQTNLTRHPGYDGTPGFSPDGTKITWRSTRMGNNIWVMNRNGSSPVRLTSGSFDRTPAFSPDGQKILFTSNRSGNNDVWTINANGSGLTNLSKAPGGDYNPDQRRAPTA